MDAPQPAPKRAPEPGAAATRPARLRWDRWLLLALLAGFAWFVWQQRLPARPADAPAPTPEAKAAPRAEAPRYRTLSAARLQAALAPSARQDRLQAELHEALFAPYRHWLRQAKGRVPDFAHDLTDAGSTLKRLGMSVQDAFGGDRLGAYVRGHFDHYLPLETWLGYAAADARRNAEQVVGRVAQGHHQRVAELLGALSIQPPTGFGPDLQLDTRWLDHMAAVSRDSAVNAGKGAALGLLSGALFAKAVLGAGAAFAPKTLGASAAGAALFAGIVTVARNDAEEAEFRYAAYKAISHLEAKLDFDLGADAAHLAQTTLDRLEADTARLVAALDGQPIALPFDHPLALEFGR
ncbi:MAG: hypothetical protein KC613_18085 [Myxococcales bacterium]|nr:hypothetical protein [Myxococcales bacterium]